MMKDNVNGGTRRKLKHNVSREMFPTHLRQMIYLYDLLCSHSLTLKEIQYKWDYSSVGMEEELSSKKFQRFKDRIEEFFGITVHCDRHNFTYHINKAADIRSGTLRAWMLDTARVGTLLLDSFEVGRYFFLEDMPSGKNFLYPLMEAFRSHSKVSFLYQRYSEEKPKNVIGSPFCVRQYKQRWYLMMLCDGKYKTYSLDRIVALELLKNNTSGVTRPPEEDMFDEFFAIYSGKEVPFEKDIVIRAYGDRVKYLRDLPLHCSQKEVITTPEFSDFHFSFRPDRCFISEIIRMAGQLEVLQPAWIRDEIASAAKRLLELHSSSH